jgi:hypothetical protein
MSTQNPWQYHNYGSDIFSELIGNGAMNIPVDRNGAMQSVPVGN